MASLFDFLFDSLPFAVAHHGAYLATFPPERTTIRDGLRLARLGPLRRQMLRLTTARPAVLRNGVEPPRDEKGHLWSLGIGTDLDNVGRGTCKVREQDFEEMVVFERIQFGREIEGSMIPSVAVTDWLDNELELPLTQEFLLDEWAIVATAEMPLDAVANYPTETKPDIGLIRVFMYELNTDAMEIVQLNPMAMDPEERAAFDRYERAAALLDSSLLAPGDEDDTVGEDLCAFEPFYTSEELAIAGTIGFDEAVKFAVQRPRFLVAVSVQLCRENADLEPGAVLGAAKFHPSILVSASTTLKRVDAAVRVERPKETLNLTRPGHCACGEMHREIRPLLITDTNIPELLYPAKPAPPPYWGNFFSYYVVDPHVSHPGRQWEMIRPLAGQRSARGYIERLGPALVTDVSSNLTFKVAGQGEVDNVHLAPRMHLNAATHVSPRREPLFGQPIEWRQIRPNDHLELDPITMAPFCAHDCLHFHARWADHATARHVRGWARDPLLIDAARAVEGVRGNKGTKALLERCVARKHVPNSEAGASMYPPWHAVDLRVESNAVLVSIRTVVPTLPGQRELLFHAPWAYAVYMADYLDFALGTLVSIPKSYRQQFTLGKWREGGSIQPILPTESVAAFYWVLRYRSIEHEDGSYESRDYHHHRDLEKALRL